jgi:SAM-dependent methyltransferase
VVQCATPFQRTDVVSALLPSFTNNRSNKKLFEPLTLESLDKGRVQGWILDVIKRHPEEKEGRTPSLRILDFGCGRGDAVAVLRQLGYLAFGVDVSAAYVDNARPLLDSIDEGTPIVSLLSADGRSVFPDHFFDVVLTDQVLEHVPYLESAVHEISRLTKPGGIGIHLFPARFSVFEPHLFQPFVHWLPKGAFRRRVIQGLIFVGIGADYFHDYSVREQASIFASFSERETFYRPLKSIWAAFTEDGFRLRNGVGLKFSARSGVAGSIFRTPYLSEFCAWVYSHFVHVVIIAVKE